MIAKYNGVCVFCGKDTLAGVDQYDPTKKRAWHVACLFPDDEDQIALAERLGYRQHEEWNEFRR